MKKRNFEWMQNDLMKSGLTFLALVVAMLFSVSTVFAQGRGNGYGREVGFKPQVSKTQCKQNLRSGSSVVITKTWVEEYPYGYRVKKHRKMRRVAVHHPKGTKVVILNGKKYFVKDGRYFSRVGSRFVVKKPIRNHRNF